MEPLLAELAKYGLQGIVIGACFYAISRLYKDNRATTAESQSDGRAAVSAINSNTSAVVTLSKSLDEQVDGQQAIARATEENARALRAIEATLINLMGRK